MWAGVMTALSGALTHSQGVWLVVPLHGLLLGGIGTMLNDGCSRMLPTAGRARCLDYRLQLPPSFHLL